MTNRTASLLGAMFRVARASGKADPRLNAAALYTFWAFAGPGDWRELAVIAGVKPPDAIERVRVMEALASPSPRVVVVHKAVQ